MQFNSVNFFGTTIHKAPSDNVTKIKFKGTFYCLLIVFKMLSQPESTCVSLGGFLKKKKKKSLLDAALPLPVHHHCITVTEDSGWPLPLEPTSRCRPPLTIT